MSQNGNSTPTPTPINPEVLKKHFEGLRQSATMAEFAESSKIPEKLAEQLTMLLEHYNKIVELTQK
jgi:hypothetical protein